MTEAEWLVSVEPMPMLEFLRGKLSARKGRLCCVGACRHIREGVREHYLRHSPNDVYELDPTERQIAQCAESRADGRLSSDEVAGLPKTSADLAEFGDSLCAEILLAARYAVGLSVLSYGYASAEDLIEATFHHCAVGEDEDLLPTFPHSREKDLGTWSRRNRSEFESAVAGYEEDFEEGYGRCVVMAGFDTDLKSRIKQSGHNAMQAESRYQAQLLRDIFGNPFRPVAFSPSWRTDTAVSLARTMYESRDFGAMPILADALQDAGCGEAAVLDHCRGPGPHVRGCWVVDLVLGKE